MPLKPGKSNKVVSENISELTHHGSKKRPHKQIVAIALANADRHPYARGGEVRKLAGGGLTGLDATIGGGNAGLGQADYPTVTIQNATPQYSGLGMFAQQPQGITPGASGLPYALQMQAVQQAQKAQQLPQLPPANATPAGPITPYGASAAGPMADPAQYAKGGGVSFSGGVGSSISLKPPRSLARTTEPIAGGGFLNSHIPGRTDRLAVNVKNGSHVIPADVVSSLGQGNSLAGARHLDMTMRALPSSGFKRGGHVKSDRIHGHEPILAAGGEYIVTPEEVRAIGEGNVKKGHDLLDKMIVNVRKREAKRMLKLPPPKK